MGLKFMLLLSIFELYSNVNNKYLVSCLVEINLALNLNNSIAMRPEGVPCGHTIVKDTMSYHCEGHNVMPLWRTQCHTIVKDTMSYHCEGYNVMPLWRTQCHTIVKNTMSYHCEEHNVIPLWRTQCHTIVKDTMSYHCEGHNVLIETYSHLKYSFDCFIMIMNLMINK